MNVPKALDPSEIDSGRRFSRVVSPAAGALFLLLGDRNVVFNEATQKIYALNQTAAYIWCRLQEDGTPETICAELTRSGISPSLAMKHVQEALRHWLKLGLLTTEYDFNFDALPCGHAFNLDIAGFDVTVRVSSERLARTLSLFDHLATPARESPHVLHVIEADGLVHVFHNKLSVICCDEIEVAPSIKAYITEQILKMSAPNVVFHAACLVRDEKSILISGRPGAGKTTLTLRLMEAGFAYGTDDIVMIEPDGRATGVPFAPTVKSGAWDIVSQFRPDLRNATVHRRVDAKRVRYLSPVHLACDDRYPVGWIIFIKRAFGSPRLKPLDPVDAIRRMMGGSYSPDGRMNLTACSALKRTLAGASSFELTYSDLAEANDIIERLCDG